MASPAPATPIAFTWNGKVYAGYNVLMDGGPYPVSTHMIQQPVNGRMNC